VTTTEEGVLFCCKISCFLAKRVSLKLKIRPRLFSAFLPSALSSSFLLQIYFQKMKNEIKNWKKTKMKFFSKVGSTLRGAKSFRQLDTSSNTKK